MAGLSEGPERVVATEDHAGRTCPYCRFPLKQGGQLALCGHCRSAHHADCWDDNGGCAVLACAGGPGKEATAAPAGMAAAGAAAGRTAFMPPAPSRPPAPVWPTARVPQAAPPPTPPPPSGGGGFGSKSLVIALLVLAVAVGGFAAALVLTKKKNSVDTARVAATTAKTTTPKTPSATTQTVTVQSKPPTQVQNSPSAPVTNNPPSSTGNASSSSSSSGDTAGPDAGAATTLDQYWQDVSGDDYQAAVNMETSSEQHDRSVSDFQADQPHVVINSTGTPQPVSDGSGDATVEIDFDSQNTAGSDTACRHFTIDSLMVPSGGSWLYGGAAPGSSTTDDTVDSSNCQG